MQCDEVELAAVFAQQRGIPRILPAGSGAEVAAEPDRRIDLADGPDHPIDPVGILLRRAHEARFPLMVAVIALVGDFNEFDVAGLRKTVGCTLFRPRMGVIGGGVQVFGQFSGGFRGGQVAERDQRLRTDLAAEAHQFRDAEFLERPFFLWSDGGFPVEVVGQAAAGIADQFRSGFPQDSDQFGVGSVEFGAPCTGSVIAGGSVGPALIAFAVAAFDVVSENIGVDRPLRPGRVNRDNRGRAQ